MDRTQIEQLLNPACYPDITTTVMHRQTHISHLFLTDQYVYKIKKAVDFGFLDFTTLEKRRFYCHEELRLNRRLSPDIYLAVVAVYRNKDGALNLSGNGQIYDYAVKMRRLPEERMLSVLLATGQVSEADIDAVAETVARFHAKAEQADPAGPFGNLASIRSNWEQNLLQTEAYFGRTLSQQDHKLIADWVRRRLDQDAGLLRQRLRDGFVRECDGDLHSENICLDGQVHIFDCIEFNEAFRICDTAADVAFLAMDLENHGRLDLAERFVQQYCLISGDEGLRQVLLLYQVNRAVIRGKVESFRLDDPLLDAGEKAAACGSARRFFRLARGYILREQLPPALFITYGPTGCGKSALAAELCFQLGMPHYSSDRERKRLAGILPTERSSAVYSADWNKATYDRLFTLAEKYLALGHSALVDATFLRRRDRERFVQLACNLNAVPILLVLDCPADLAKKRLEQRRQQPDAVSDGTWEVYQRQIASMDPPSADEAQLVRLNASLAPETLVDVVLTALELPTLEK